MAAFREMHVLPAKHSYVSATDGQTDGRTDNGQSDPYVWLCYTGDTKMDLLLGTHAMVSQGPKSVLSLL